MNYFYKLPTKVEDTNPVYYINLLNIQSIATTVEVLPSANGGQIKRACLIVNGIKYVYDSVELAGIILVPSKSRVKEFEESNEEKELEFKRIQARLEMIVQDIQEKTRLCHQESDKIEIERLKSAFALDTEMLEKAEKREDNAKEIIKKIEKYCELKLANFNNTESEVAMCTHYAMIDILRIIGQDKDINNRIKKICGIDKSEPEYDPLDALR